MTTFLEHFVVFFQIFLMCLFLALSGFLFKKFIINVQENNTFEENGLFGFLLIGFLALFVNFFFPLNLIVNNFLFVVIVYLGYKFKFFNQNKKKLFKDTLYVTLIAYIFFIYSNVNTPDALLYHLPYSKIINEHKIILGISNLHFRFGHISIFQYISSFFVNNIFNTNGLLIPISLLTSFFFIYAYKKFNKTFDNFKTRLNSYLIFLFLIFSFYSFNRYSGWGNDAQVHIYYFLSIIYLLDYFSDKNSLVIFKKVSLISLFTFLIKPFYIISLIMPLIIYALLRKKNIILRSRFFIFSFLFISLWFLKNILVSGCLIYPITITCNSNIAWFNNEAKLQSLSGEAWSKDWINRNDKNLNHEQYNKDFIWVSTWSKNHFLVIKEKLIPVFSFLFLNILFFYFAKCLKSKHKINNSNNKFYLLLLLINLLGLLVWFIKFPIYRYGSSYIYSSIVFLFYFIFIRFVNFKRLIKIKYVFVFFIYIFFSGIMIKNLDRIVKNYNNPISPIIFDNIKDSDVVKVTDHDGKFIHFTPSNRAACGYTLSPCSHYMPNIKIKKFLGYIIYLNL
tara:strand:- start:121 stop:1809 length:1689 start_codon:yes stop_codon:yes gene_type:complete